jgi:hypothetical protein
MSFDHPIPLTGDEHTADRDYGLVTHALDRARLYNSEHTRAQ